MAQPQTLLRFSDIIFFTGLPKEFPACEWRVIFGIEYFEFTNKLGYDFYLKLISELVDYSSVADYDSTSNYTTGDFVKYSGIFYEAIDDSTGKSPNNTLYWKFAPRFATECYEILWCNFLGEYLSWCVVLDRLPLLANQIHQNGVVKLMSAVFEAADNKDFHVAMKSVSSKKDRCLFNLDNWMRTNNDEKCFDLYIGLIDNSCSSDEFSLNKSGYAYRFG